MTFGSLFAGIGGMDLGLERAGMTCKWQVEIDPYAQKVLAKRWPEVIRYGDVRGVVGAEVAPVDLICGGFPCQDISNAGKRAGIDGTRSGLWSEYARIIREVRPKYVLVENVAALLARGLGRVLGDLATLGFDAEWDCVPASAVGAHHRRDRLFLVAYAKRVGRGLQPEQRTERCHPAVAGYDGQEEPVAHSAGPGLAVFRGREAGRELGGWRAACGGGWWNTEPDVGRVAHGVPNRVDRLRCLGNAVVPQVAEFIGRRIMRAAQT